MLRGVDPAAAGLVARDPRTGAWVSFDPGELPADADVGLDVLPDGLLDDELTALLDDHAGGEVPVEETPTGPGLARALADTDVTAVSTYGVVEAVAGWARLAAWVAAQQAAAVAELTTRPELQPERCGYRSVFRLSRSR